MKLSVLTTLAFAQLALVNAASFEKKEEIASAINRGYRAAPTPEMSVMSKVSAENKQKSLEILKVLHDARALRLISNTLTFSKYQELYKKLHNDYMETYLPASKEFQKSPELAQYLRTRREAMEILNQIDKDLKYRNRN